MSRQSYGTGPDNAGATEVANLHEPKEKDA